MPSAAPGPTSLAGQTGLSGQPSAELLAAQEQLLRLRREQRATRRAAGEELRTDEAGRLLDAEACQVSENLAGLGKAAIGFESFPFSEHIRAALLRRAARARLETCQVSESLAGIGPRVETCQVSENLAGLGRDQDSTVPLLPDLALAILRRELAGAGRLWLLLRLLDSEGKGWLYLQEAQAQLATPASPLRFCGARQLRSLLAQGEPIFWERQAEPGSGKVRLWLRSPAKVARALECGPLSQRPVALPVRHLLGGIGQVRAHFYAAYHSARGSGGDSTPESGPPISRETLRRLSAVSPSSQRTYERRVGVMSRPNWAVGPLKSRATQEQLAWRHGRALFTFVDKAGRQGPAGGEYLAWRLPNSYAGPHARLAQTRKRRTNQQLRDLAQIGTPGNGEPLRREERRRREAGRGREERRVYCADGRQAAAGSMETGQARYWPGATKGRGRFWYAMGVSDEW